MPKVTVGIEAPDFEMTTVQGDRLHLSDYRGRQAVLLVFNRGFV
jgi:peroxiredoxin